MTTGLIAMNEMVGNEIAAWCYEEEQLEILVLGEDIELGLILTLTEN